MIKEIEISGLKCVCVPNGNSAKVVYMIYPEIVAFKNEWLQEMSDKYGFPLVAVYIPADGWNNMLTPWPEPGETPDAPPFAGEAAKTLEVIRNEVVPGAEKALGLQNVETRDLV